MTEAHKAAIREHVAAWQRAAPGLQQVRDEDIRTTKTPEAMQLFAGSALWAVQHRPESTESGLVEQQRWFVKASRA